MEVWKARTADGVYLKLRYIGRDGHVQFVMNPGGTLMWVSWSGTATPLDVAALCLGPVFGCLLRQRGLTCLHASVVSLHGRALAFLGAKGSGKSTTAMSLVQCGAAVVADDMAVLDCEHDRFGVRLGQPCLRLGPQSANVFGSYEGLDPLWSQVSDRPQKRAARALAAATRDARAISPLACIYILEPRGHHAEPLCVGSAPTSADSLARLMAHRYASYALDRAGHARDFAVLSRLVASTPVRHVSRPHALDRLTELADLIVRDAQHLMAA